MNENAGRHYFPKDWWPLLIYIVSIIAGMLITIMYVRVDLAEIKKDVAYNHENIKDMKDDIKEHELQLNSIEQSIGFMYRRKTKK